MGYIITTIDFMPKAAFSFFSLEKLILKSPRCRAKNPVAEIGISSIVLNFARRCAAKKRANCFSFIVFGFVV